MEGIVWNKLFMCMISVHCGLKNKLVIAELKRVTKVQYTKYMYTDVSDEAY